MNINEFKKLEDIIKKQDFNKSYKIINNVLYFLSIFGNLASMFLAFFFISKIITGAITEASNQTIVLIVSVILLAGLEYLKRDLFDKFSMEYLRFKDFLKKEVLTLMMFSLLVISFSFYSSLRGAKEFSSKSIVIEQKTQESINQYNDSLTKVYNIKISNIESEIKDTKSKIESKDKEQTELESQIKLTTQQKLRIRDLKKDKELLRTEVSTNELKITNTKAELSTTLSNYKEGKSKDSSGKKDENEKNSFMFVIMSTLIELIILIG